MICASSASASSRRPACSCASASARHWSIVFETGGAGTGAKLAARLAIDRIPKAGDDRLQDRDDRLEMLQVMPVAVARAVVELLGHLGVACRAGIALVLVELQAALVEAGADEAQHAPDVGFLIVDDVLVADRQGIQDHLAPG